MEDRIKNQFNDEILKEIVSRFNLDYGETKPLDGFENFMFYSKRNSRKYVLRIAHTMHRTKDEILGELEFLKYLNENMATVIGIIHHTKKTIIMF